MKASRIILLSSLVITLLIVQTGTADAGSFDHSLFDKLLRRYVADGLVDYRGLKEDPQLLNDYLEKLENADPNGYQNWSDNEKIAFWINAYNAITIYGIATNYPIENGSGAGKSRFPKSSIRQISNFWKTPFRRVMGKEVTLDEIEHKILRKQFDEPRIHCALVCASIGCPPLRTFAFNPDSLDQQLDNSAHKFINETGGARIATDGKVLYLSKIFDWYGDDFKTPSAPIELADYNEKQRGVLKFIVDHADETLARYILEQKPKIKYSDYDWSLNEQSSR